jgi:hypothetical protein
MNNNAINPNPIGDSLDEMPSVEIQPTVTTDKSDYMPGETVTITAKDFALGSVLEFQIADWATDPGDDGDADLYAPFSVMDGGAGDLDGLVNGQVVVNWRVPTDNNGTGSGIPDALNATLDLKVSGSNGQVATTTFTDGTQKLWAWRNQPGPTLNTWDAGTTIQSANSVYAEDEVIPFRWTIETGNPSPQLQEGVAYTIQLDYAFRGGPSSSKYFFDYLTSYNKTEATTPAFGLGSGLTGFTSGNLSTIAVPTDPGTAFQTAGVFDLFNIKTSSVVFGSYIVDPVNTNQEDRRLTITFTPDDGDGIAGEFVNVGVAWGAHLASQVNYGFQNGAASFPGASPQMVVDLNPTTSGDQTNLNINPNAIVPQGQITIIKDAIPNVAQDLALP